jgi:hypothetical protein
MRRAGEMGEGEREGRREARKSCLRITSARTLSEKWPKFTLIGPDRGLPTGESPKLSGSYTYLLYYTLCANPQPCTYLEDSCPNIGHFPGAGANLTQYDSDSILLRGSYYLGQ